MNPRPDPLDALFAALDLVLREDAALAREFLASRREFFHGTFDAARYERDELARRRHLEWFLLERVSPSFERLAVEHIAAHHAVRTGLDDPVLLLSLLHSHAGVFEVTSVNDGGLWIHDLASSGEYPVVDPDASHVLAPADLIAGRIFPTSDGAYRISRAATVHRNKVLLEALRGDMERARSTRRGVLRVSQRELEGMFFAADLTGTPADPVGEARALLVQSGVEQEEVDGWFEDLAQVPFEREQLVVGADGALAPILDRLAFETGADLDVVRRALIHAWEHLSANGPGSGPSLRPERRAVEPESPADIARALAALEAKRKSGAPLDVVFDELEAELAIDGESAEETDLAAPDFPGVVEAVITEFLWETETTLGPERARELERIKSFGRFAHDIGVFENVSMRDLLAYAAWWLPESGELENGDDARSALAALASFCRWADETHAVELHRPFHETLNSLMTSLPRVTEANRRRTRAADPSQGELYEVLDARDGAARLRDRGHGEHDVRIEPDLATWLRPGDRVRAQRHDDGRVAIYCCYPPESRALEGALSGKLDADDSDEPD